MEKVITNELKRVLKEHEGIKSNAYLDSKGILTIGIGNNVSRKSGFMELKLVDMKSGHLLTESEKENIYSRIMSDITTKTFSETNYLQYQVPQIDIENKLNLQLEQSYHELERKFLDFKTFPISVQQALLDMQFNMGTPKFSENKWPNLFDAVKNRDWGTAAKESERKDVQRARREWTRNKFLQAV